MPQTVTNRRGLLTGLSLKAEAIYPPGVTVKSVQNCSGCGGCAEICPTQIITIQGGVPSLDFTRGECSFCGKCAERCPERVFPLERASSFSHIASIGEDCLALNYVDCQSCRDACPVTAIRFNPRRGGPFIPVLETDACTGCGACISVCPTQSISVATIKAELCHV